MLDIVLQNWIYLFAGHPVYWVLEGNSAHQVSNTINLKRKQEFKGGILISNMPVIEVLKFPLDNA